MNFFAKNSNFVAMKLRTEINIEPLSARIEYSNHIFTIGSCFAQRVGDEMRRAKLRCTINPTGTLFNPHSISSTIERLAERRHITREELHEGEQGWYHFDFHSSLNAATADECLSNINRAIDNGYERLSCADWVVVTLGTAWIYELAESGELVANCHKRAAREFVRRRLSVGEIVERLQRVITNHLGGKRVIFTVSPIRHIADGLAENSLSKATLRLAVEQLIEVDKGEHLHYFPSYEIMLDDLRDYRFYSEDMVHPSRIAVEYIWHLFCEWALSERAMELMPRVMKIIRASEHRAINPTSEAHRRLCESQLRAIAELKEVDLSEEFDYFHAQLKINL